MKKIIVLLLSFLLCSCSFLFKPRELTPEEKEERRQYIVKMDKTVVSPVFHLNRYLCTYHKKNESWPGSLDVSENSDYFEYIDIQEKDSKNLSVAFKMKAMHQSVIYKITANERVYTSSFTTKNANFSNSYVCDESRLLEVDTLAISELVVPIITISETAATYKPSPPTFGEKVAEILVKGGLCIALGVKPEQCR